MRTCSGRPHFEELVGEGADGREAREVALGHRQRGRGVVLHDLGGDLASPRQRSDGHHYVDACAAESARHLPAHSACPARQDGHLAPQVQASHSLGGPRCIAHALQSRGTPGAAESRGCRPEKPSRSAR